MEWFTSKKPATTATTTNTNESTSTSATSSLSDSGKSSAANMRKLSSQISVQKAEKAMAEAKSDYERRLKVLTHCLEEKAEENVTLAESNRELHQKFVQLDQKLKHLVEENTSTDKDNSSKNRERSNKEIEKKLEMMAETLNILASDNISLRSLNDECEKNKKFGKGDKSARDSEKKAPVGKAKSAKAQEDEYIANLKKEVLRLSQIEESCDESVLLYENTIKEMNQKMKIALKKEQERRKKAEFDVQRLKQKNRRT